MGRKLPADVNELLRRAEPARKKNTPIAAQPRAAQQGAPRVYSGDPQEKTPGYAVRPVNKKSTTPRKRKSTFNIVAFLFLAAIGVVAYISNILAVNQLVLEVHRLEATYESIRNRNGMLDAEVHKKSAPLRIRQLAAESLKMVDRKDPEETFEVDKDKLESFSTK